LNISEGTVVFSGGAVTIGSISGGGNLMLSAGLVTGGNDNSTTFSGSMSGSQRLTKTGAGSLTLARAAGNTYSGGTIVSGGTLVVNNTSGSGTGSGSVLVNSGATLGGTGSITGIVTNSGNVAPGVGVGSLNLSSSYTQ